MFRTNFFISVILLISASAASFGACIVADDCPVCKDGTQRAICRLTDMSCHCISQSTPSTPTATRDVSSYGVTTNPLAN